MANLQQAPVLKFNGEKDNGNFYKLPQNLMDIVFNELGNSSAQLRIMIVLLGTKPDAFSISDKWICDRTGLLHPSYINARKALINRGWLTLNKGELIVNINNIYNENRSNTTLPDEENSRSNMVLPERSNTILPHCSNTVLPIIDNRIDNKTDKGLDKSNSLRSLDLSNYETNSKEEFIF